MAADFSPTLPADGLPDSPTPPSLQVSGVFVTKAQLLAALQLFLPQLADIELVPGDRFLLHLGAAPDIVPTPLERLVP